MKDEKEKTKPTKKRIVTYYLVLAACLLVIAAIVVGVVFAVNGTQGGGGDVIDNTQTPDDSSDGDGDSDGDGSQTPDDEGGDGNADGGGNGSMVDTSSKYEFIVPVATVNVTQAHTFWYDATMDWYCLHNGIDFSADAGTEVYAAVDGTVTAITTSDVFYGGTITIAHADNVVTVYRYIDPVETLEVGDEVSRGDVIATVAAATGSEAEEGSHLHFEVYVNGNAADPDDYLNITQK